LLNLDIFFTFYSKKSGKEKIVVIAKETKWVAARVKSYKQRRCWFVLCDFLFLPEIFTKSRNFLEGYKGCIKKIIDYSGTSAPALTSFQCTCCDFPVIEMYLRESC
jgi:hypothetical protein